MGRPRKKDVGGRPRAFMGGKDYPTAIMRLPRPVIRKMEMLKRRYTVEEIVGLLGSAKEVIAENNKGKINIEKEKATIGSVVKAQVKVSPKVIPKKAKATPKKAKAAPKATPKKAKAAPKATPKKAKAIPKATPKKAKAIPKKEKQDNPIINTYPAGSHRCQHQLKNGFQCGRVSVNIKYLVKQVRGQNCRFLACSQHYNENFIPHGRIIADVFDQYKLDLWGNK